MLIDTSFDLRTDGGKDADAYSVTLCRYNKLLWSKVLPSGALFDLEVSRRHGAYALHHRSELGEFSLTSDTIIHSYTKWDKSPIKGWLSDEENKAFRTIGSTIGGKLVFPGNRIDRKQTINGARGCNWQIRDRFDLTLECIRRHYIGGEPSPLGETLKRYGDFFALFGDFRGYVEFFMLQDLVFDDYSAVRFFMPFDDFRTPPVPGDVDTYREYRRRSIEFVEARNRRIDRYSASLHELLSGTTQLVFQPTYI